MIDGRWWMNVLNIFWGLGQVSKSSVLESGECKALDILDSIQCSLPTTILNLGLQRKDNRTDISTVPRG